MYAAANEPSLPVFGAGPIFAIFAFGVSGLSILLWWSGVFSSGQLTAPLWVFSLRIIAALLVVLGIFLWVGTVVLGRMVQNIRAGKLMTTGFYAWVRNPLYAGILLLNCGLLLALANLWVGALPLLYWWFLTVLLKVTEEKWLLAKFGADYVAYTHRVNRCWPWFPRRDWQHAYQCDC
ncbi:MAG: isoprenylcysteine carboxylmethyltransferase family protein [Actinomycetaceae bacterium]|nr:isoprenylcysteine carboxylmethyltransferase family protein [Actinomycetaceae bacterium]